MYAIPISITPDIPSFPSIPPDVPSPKGLCLRLLHHTERPSKWSSYFWLIHFNDMRETCPTTRGSFGIAQG